MKTFKKFTRLFIHLFNIHFVVSLQNIKNHKNVLKGSKECLFHTNFNNSVIYSNQRSYLTNIAQIGQPLILTPFYNQTTEHYILQKFNLCNLHIYIEINLVTLSRDLSRSFKQLGLNLVPKLKYLLSFATKVYYHLVEA